MQRPKTEIAYIACGSIAVRYKTLFRLWLRALGVYFVVTGLTGLVSNLVTQVVTYGNMLTWEYQWQIGLPQLFMILAGLYLFFGGRWITDRAVPSNRPYCPECGYELSHASGEHCPECGTRISPAGHNNATEPTHPS